MKKFNIALILLFIVTNLIAQVIPVSPLSTGYFFHPTSPRSFNLVPPLALVAPNTYETQVADATGFSFRFSVDAQNNLTNWIAIGGTPSSPSSGFMTADNPGNFAYSVTPGPGTSPYTQSLYNNTYDPLNHTFYLHYGYHNGSNGTIIGLEEHFDAGVPATWTTINNSAPVGTTTWSQGDVTFTSHSGAATSYVKSDYQAAAIGVANTISNWLVTPVISIKNGDVISFWSRIPTLAQSGGVEYPDRLEVRISTNGTSINVGSTAVSVGDFTNLLLTINPTQVTGVYPQAWTQFTATVSGVSGTLNGRVAFRAFETDNGSGANEDVIGLDDFIYNSAVIPTQNNYERQVYEKLVFTPTPTITSATPLFGNIFTPITITGHGFQQGDGVNFGNAYADSVVVFPIVF